MRGVSRFAPICDTVLSVADGSGNSGGARAGRGGGRQRILRAVPNPQESLRAQEAPRVDTAAGSQHGATRRSGNFAAHPRSEAGRGRMQERHGERVRRVGAARSQVRQGAPAATERAAHRRMAQRSGGEAHSTRLRGGRSTQDRRAPLNPQRSHQQRSERQQRTEGKLRSAAPHGANSAAAQAAMQRRNRLIRAVALWVVVIAAVCGAVFAAVHAIRGSIDDIEASTAAPDPKDAFREVPCTPELLNTAFKQSATYAGKPVDFSVALANKGAKRACYLNAGYADMHVRVTSGTELIWDSQVCAAGDKTNQLLINAGSTATFAVQWPGVAAGAKCAGTAPAQPGTYHAQFLWHGKPVGSELTFELKAEPAKVQPAKPAQPQSAAGAKQQPRTAKPTATTPAQPSAATPAKP